AQSKVAADAKSETPGSENATPGSADELIKAAMARAAARQASPEQQQAKLERGLETATNRLKFAEQKLADARRGSAETPPASAEQLEQLQARVEEARLKLEEAQRKLDSFTPAVIPAEKEPSTAGAIGDRLKDKIEASPKTQLENKIATLKERIATTEAKIAEESDDRVRAALNSGLDKQRHKLADAEHQLAELGDDGDKPVDDPIAVDAAAAAIARAQAKASAMATLSPLEKLEASIESLNGRIAKAREKLATAQAENSEHVETLQNALEKLEAKLASTEQERRHLQQGEQA
ncbi:MAG: hypothetical protein AB7U63_16995, partial [Porticoccaceae bacterium]